MRADEMGGTHKGWHTQRVAHTTGGTHKRWHTQRVAHTKGGTHNGWHTQRVAHTMDGTHKASYADNKLTKITITKRDDKTPLAINT